MRSQEGDVNNLLLETIVRDILKSVTDAIITVDERHRVIYCNESAERMFGYSPGEMIGADVSPLIPEPHHDAHRGYVKRYIDTGVPRVIGKSRECNGRRKDGSLFPVEISYSVSETGGHLYFTAVIRNITQRKEMEREVRFFEKLADIGKAVAQIVHEIRKPLMLIGGFARQMEGSESLKDDEKNRRKLNIVTEEVKRLETLLNGVRLLTRPPGAGVMTGIVVNDVLNETVDLLEPMLQNQQIELKIELAPDPAMILGDRDQLKQVFLNILQNAVEAMDGVGTISLSSKPDAKDVLIVIEDTGPGIPEHLREKVFDPFFTTKAEGTGLGLAICRNIVRDHGGSVEMRRADGGTAFILRLPLHKA